jgi:hypothetical protein
VLEALFRLPKPLTVPSSLEERHIAGCPRSAENCIHERRFLWDGIGTEVDSIGRNQTAKRGFVEVTKARMDSGFRE